MNYVERGKGEPLILIMGLSADGPVWELHAAEFEKHFRCILFDNRGVGQSDAPAGPYTSAQMADDTAALMDALKIKKAHVAGISMGGIIAQQLALRHSEKVQSQILIATWAKMDAYTTDVYKNLITARKNMAFEDFMQLLFLWIFTPAHYNKNVGDLKEGMQTAPHYEFKQTQQGFEGQASACWTHDVSDQLDKIRCPTLVTAGTQDIFVPYKFSRYLYENISGAEMVDFEGWGHTHHWEDLEKFNQTCVNFLKKHPL
jgi:pimeloyl-ACP methyl ester carboxylesterase